MTPEGQATAIKMEALVDAGNLGLVGYELIAAANVIYCELLCAGEVIETLTYGEVVSQSTKQ